VHDPQAATVELYRVAELGLRGTVFNVWDCAKPVYDAAWEPLWAAAHETGLPISYHIGGRGGMLRPDAHPAEVAAVVSTLPVALGRPVAETIFSGVFERHPNLTMVVAEAGLGWVAYLLDRMDREYEEKGMSRTLTLSAKPSELFRQHMYISFQEEAAGACGAFRSSAWTTSSGLQTIPIPIAAGRTHGRLWTRILVFWERRSSTRSPATTRCGCTVSRERGPSHASADQPSALSP